MVNQRQYTNSDGPDVVNQPERKPIQTIAADRSGCDQPLFFEQRKRSANVKGGNSVVVAVGRTDRRRIRDRVDSRNEEQQANQPDSIFKFQGVPESEAATHPAGSPIKVRNIVHSVPKFRELSHDRIGSGFRPIVALPLEDRTFWAWAIAHSRYGLPRNSATQAGKTERGGPL